MDREQASRTNSGQSVQRAVLASSEGAQGQGAQATTAQEALPLSSADTAERDRLSLDYEHHILNRAGGSLTWRDRTPSLLSLRRYKMRQAIVAQIIRITNPTRAKGRVEEGLDSINTDQWLISACDCGKCDRSATPCSQCLAKASNNESIFDKIAQLKVCIECFDHYFTMLQLGGRNDAR